MTKIYSLSIDGNVFYIGQTSQQFLAMRLSGHLNGHPQIKDLPEWIKAFIKIKAIEECNDDKANARERHWIRHYRDTGIKLFNKNIYQLKPKKGISYSKLTALQARFIMTELKYLKIAIQIGVNAETIRVAITKKRIKTEYFQKIFSPDNMLKYNAFVEKSDKTLKINLVG